MGIERLSKDQVSAICEHLDSEVEELVTRPIDASLELADELEAALDT